MARINRTEELVVPLHDFSIEEAVLGACMLEKGVFAVVNSYVAEDFFYLEKHRLVFKAMLRLFDSSSQIDILTVRSECEKMGALGEVGGAYGITKMTNSVASSAHIEEHCKAIAELYLKREGVKIAEQFKQECAERTYDVFDSYTKADQSLVLAQESAIRGSIKDMVYFATQTYTEYESVKATGVIGIKTNLHALDRTIMGLVAPDLIVVAGRPGQGKTAFALSIVKNVSVVGGVPCGIFSLEMDGTQISRRLACQIADVSHQQVRGGTLPQHQEVAFLNAIDKVSKSPIFIEDKGGMNVRDIRTRATILKRRHDIKYIVVDYLQLMEGVETKGKSRENIVSEISRGLKNLARELAMPVIALSQLSRKVEERTNKKPELSDLRESGAIEQDADSVIFLMRPEYYGIGEMVIDGKTYGASGLCMAAVEKNRHGEPKQIALRYTGYSMSFSDYDDFYALPPTSQQPFLPPTKPIQPYRNYIEPKEKDDDFLDGDDIDQSSLI